MRWRVSHRTTYCAGLRCGSHGIRALLDRFLHDNPLEFGVTGPVVGPIRDFRQVSRTDTVKFFKRRPSWGVLLLGAWLIATGLLHLVPRLDFSSSGELLAVLAIAAGVLLLLDR
jgi:hypothetical protein